MQKSITLFLALICSALGLAQPKKLSFSEQLSFGKITPSAAATGIGQWFDTYSKVTPDEAELNRRQNGIFSGVSSLKYISKVSSGSDFTRGTIYFNIKTTINGDGTYRYEVSNFIHQARVSFNLITTDVSCPHRLTTGDKMWQNLVWKDIQEQIKQAVEPMVQALKEGVQQQSAASSRVVQH